MGTGKPQDAAPVDGTVADNSAEVAAVEAAQLAELQAALDAAHAAGAASVSTDPTDEQHAALEAALGEAYAKGVEDGKEAAPDSVVAAAPVESSAPTAWIKHTNGQVWEVDRGSPVHRRLVDEGHIEVPAPEASEPA